LCPNDRRHGENYSDPLSQATPFQAISDFEILQTQVLTLFFSWILCLRLSLNFNSNVDLVSQIAAYFADANQAQGWKLSDHQMLLARTRFLSLREFGPLALLKSEKR